MKKIFGPAVFAFLIFVSASLSVVAENPVNASTKASITGKVIDIKTGESLAGVAVSIEGTDIQAYTDLDGNFTLKELNPGKYNLVLSLISYKNSLVENLKLEASQKQMIDVKLDAVR
jgi:hypothetical protein